MLRIISKCRLRQGSGISTISVHLAAISHFNQYAIFSFQFAFPWNIWMCFRPQSVAHNQRTFWLAEKYEDKKSSPFLAVARRSTFELYRKWLCDRAVPGHPSHCGNLMIACYLGRVKSEWRTNVLDQRRQWRNLQTFFRTDSIRSS